MQATEAKLLDFLKKSPQFVIPIYQRTYSWSEQQCRQLWDDIMRAGTNDAISAHFIKQWLICILLDAFRSFWPFYFPMQKLEKISPSRSSLVNTPVISQSSL